VGGTLFCFWDIVKKIMDADIAEIIFGRVNSEAVVSFKKWSQ